MFTTFIAQPIFNLLVMIYAILPGHNFGLAIIVFTALVRLVMWPLVKKQLHHTKAMRDLQPELRRIKKESAGDKQRESKLVMELYKERQVNPFSSIGLLIVQIPIFIGLYSGISRVVHHKQAVIDFTYPFVQHLPWMQHLSQNIGQFDETLFGLVNLTHSAISNAGIYWPAMVIVVLSAYVQFVQSKQLMPVDKNARSLKEVMRDANRGKQADQAEVMAATNAAMGRNMKYFLPVMIFLFTVNVASALSLYFLTSGLVAYFQQARILKQDETELVAVAEGEDGQVIEGEVIAAPEKPKSSDKKKKVASKKRNRRK